MCGSNSKIESFKSGLTAFYLQFSFYIQCHSLNAPSVITGDGLGLVSPPNEIICFVFVMMSVFILSLRRESSSPWPCFLLMSIVNTYLAVMFSIAFRPLNIWYWLTRWNWLPTKHFPLFLFQLFCRWPCPPAHPKHSGRLSLFQWQKQHVARCRLWKKTLQWIKTLSKPRGCQSVTP